MKTGLDGAKAVQELQRRIVKIREICEVQTMEGRSGRLTPDDEKLMMEVFKHHPRAAEKLKDVQYIKVGSCSKSNDPNHYTFLVMRNEEDGESISYVSCLRCLADQESGRQVTESVLSLATVSFDQQGLKVEMGGDVIALERDPSQPASAVGVRVELENKWLSLHSATREYGPYPLGKAACPVVADFLYFVLVKATCGVIVALVFQAQSATLPDFRSTRLINSLPGVFQKGPLFENHLCNHNVMMVCTSDVSAMCRLLVSASQTTEVALEPCAKGLLIGGRDNSPLQLLVDASGESTISWAAPFRCFPHTRLTLIQFAQAVFLCIEFVNYLMPVSFPLVSSSTAD